MYATRVTRVFIADVSGILRSSLTAPRYCEKKKQQNTKFRHALTPQSVSQWIISVAVLNPFTDVWCALRRKCFTHTRLLKMMQRGLKAALRLLLWKGTLKTFLSLHKASANITWHLLTLRAQCSTLNTHTHTHTHTHTQSCSQAAFSHTSDGNHDNLAASASSSPTLFPSISFSLSHPAFIR